MSVIVRFPDGTIRLLCKGAVSYDLNTIIVTATPPPLPLSPTLLLTLTSLPLFLTSPPSHLPIGFSVVFTIDRL